MTWLSRNLRRVIMGLSIHMQMQKLLKTKPPEKELKKALHMDNNHVTNVKPTEKKKKKWLSIKRKPTGEFSLFKEIAEQRSSKWYVIAKHIDEKTWKQCTKPIKLVDLWPENFSHTIPKSRGEEYRLDPDNIEIVSRAWHYKEHNWGILRVKYKN